MYRARIIPLEAQLAKKSVLLLGPRRVGKSSLIRHQYARYRVYNLLHSDIFTRLSAEPGLIRAALQPSDSLIIIDEIQKLPVLLDEVHAMIEEHGVKFLLTGSSARKLRRSHTSLMAGRAKVMRLFPFVSYELGDFDLERVLLYGTVPGIYDAEDPHDELKSYVGDYLREEIQAEALVRRIEGFSRFLNRAALSNTELLNFESVARDAQVPGRTIREYYHLLEETLVGVMLEPLQTQGTRKAVSKGKFYFFDVGVAHALTSTWALPPDSTLWGRAFEHYIFQELFAYASYRGFPEALKFWRLTTGQEVDFILGEAVAIEVKSTRRVDASDFKGLRALHQEHTLARQIIVSRDPFPRQIGDIELMPYAHFLQALWADQLI